LQSPYLYHIDPRIELIRDFISADVCEHFVSIGESKLIRSKVMNDEGGSKYADARTSQHCWIPLSHDRTVTKVAESICSLVELPLENAESFQLVRYRVNQEYRPHYDAFDTDNVAGKEAFKNGGQRLVTAILYLNEVEEGGNTNFPNLGFEVEPSLGGLLIFRNCLESGLTRHPKSLHGGMPVLKGEKWITNLWFRKDKFIKNS